MDHWLGAPKPMGNLPTGGTHTTFVRAGHDDLWVHNARCGPDGPDQMNGDPTKPKGVRADQGKTNVPPGTDHVHYGDEGPTWHNDGTVGHVPKNGPPKGPLPKDQPEKLKDWIEGHGWPRLQ